RADAVGAALDARKRRLDLPEDVLGVLLEGEVQLSVVGLGRRVGEVVVVRRLLAGVVVKGAGRLLAEVLERSLDPRAFLEQHAAALLGFYRRRPSSPAPALRRCSICDGPRPVS